MESLDLTGREGFQRRPGWCLAGSGFDLRSNADDFTMFVRRAPRYGPGSSPSPSAAE